MEVEKERVLFSMEGRVSEDLMVFLVCHPEVIAAVLRLKGLTLRLQPHLKMWRKVLDGKKVAMMDRESVHTEKEMVMEKEMSLLAFAFVPMCLTKERTNRWASGW